MGNTLKEYIDRSYLFYFTFHSLYLLLIAKTLHYDAIVTIDVNSRLIKNSPTTV